MESSAQISVNPRKIAAFLAVLIGGLVLANLVVIGLNISLNDSLVERLYGLFSLNMEYNIPTYFASIQLLLCAGLLAVLSLIDRECNTSRSLYWLGLALIFLFLSLDETVGLHEQLSKPIRSRVSLPDLLHFAWVIPYTAFAGAVALVYLKFCCGYPPKSVA